MDGRRNKVGRPIKCVVHISQLKKDDIRFWCEILTGLATVISAIIVVLTLHEMQVQRNNAYMPDVIFETASVTVSWGNPQSLDEYDTVVEEEANLNPSSINLPVRNIGVGVAKKLSFTITHDNYIAWLSLFNELNPENQYTYTQNGNRLNVSNGATEVSFNADYHIEKAFLLPDAEETYVFVIPMQYTALLQEIFSTRNAAPVDIPDLKIQVCFEDVQGIKYEQTVLLAIEDYILVQDSDKNGFATYQIVMK